MNMVNSWKPIIDKFKRKLSGWKERTLSFGGRLTLIKSVLGSLPTYYLSCFKAPIKIINELERLRRRFLGVVREIIKGLLGSNGKMF